MLVAVLYTVNLGAGLGRDEEGWELMPIVYTYNYTIILLIFASCMDQGQM